MFFFGLGFRVIVIATAGAVGKWESRGLGEISKERWERWEP